MIQVGAVPHDLAELVERIAPFRPPSFVRREIAGNDVRPDWIKVRVTSNFDRLRVLLLAKSGRTRVSSLVSNPASPGSIYRHPPGG